MNSSASILLLLAYVIPLAILAAIFLKPNIGMKTKWLIVALMPLAYIAHYHSLYSFAGWPINSSLPDEFELIAQRIEQPNKQKNTAGKIYLWIKTDDNKQPRAYQIPYSKKLHTKLDEAEKAQAAGKQQVGKREKSAPGEAGQPENPHESIQFNNKHKARPPEKSTQ